MDVEMREMDGLSGTRQIKEELPTIRLLVLSSLDIFFSSRKRHTRNWRGWSSDVCSSDRDRPLVASDRVVEGRMEGRLDADDLDRGLQRRRASRNSGEEAAATDRDEDLVGVGTILEHLE